MQYLLLIYDKEADWNKLSEADQAAVYKEYGEFTQRITQSGHYKGGHQLQPVSTATTVRVRDKKRVVTDGPFAETREQLGGFFLIDAKDLDEAIDIASHVPAGRWGTVEIRPLVEIEGLPKT